MTRRRLAGALGTAVLFAFFLLVLFPTDALVRRLLARATPPGFPAVAFEHATLRPSGLRLDGVTLRASSGAALLAADQVRLHPSLRGLLGDGSGRPLAIEVDLCRGRGEAVVTAEGPVTAVALDWHDIDLAACPRLHIAGGALEGRADGVARVRLAPLAPPEGTGTIELREALWQGGGRLAAFGALHAEAATVRWGLRDGRVVFDALELSGPEVSATGSGEVDLADPVPESALTLALAVTPAPEAPGRIRFLFGIGGDPTATRRFTVAGTLAAPRVQME